MSDSSAEPSDESLRAELARARGLVAEIEIQKAAVLALVDQLEAVSNQLLRGAAAIGEEAKSFGGRAREHGKAGRAWLVATIILIVVLAVYLYLAWGRYAPAVDEEYAWRSIVSEHTGRLLGLALISYSIRSSVKIYNAHRFNEVQNYRRENALNVIPALLASTSTEEARNQIVFLATSAILAVSITGYENGSNSVGDDPGPTPTSEIFRILGNQFKADRS